MQRLALALTVTLLGTLIGVLVFIDFQHIRKNEEDKLSTQTTLVATNLQLHMRSANLVLEETLALLDFASAEEQLERMHSLVNAMPIIRGIGILDSRGVQTLGTRRTTLGMDLSERPYFRNVLASPERQRLYVSTPFHGVTGSLSIALSKAIFDQKNRFQGVVFAVLDPDYIGMLMESTLYAPDMWAALMHDQSGDAVRVGASSPDGTPDIVSGEQLYSRLPGLATEGRATFLSDEGAARAQILAASTVVGYAGNADRPLLVVAGRDYHEAMAAWRRLAHLQGGLFALFSFAALAALLFYQHRRRQYDARRAADQRRMRAREHDYRVIVEHTAECVVKLDADGRPSYVNPAFCTVFGLAAAQAQNRSFIDQIIDADRDLARQSLAAALRHTSEQRFEARCATPGGARHMEWTFCSVIDDDGLRSSVIGVGHDVSAHIAMRDELRNRAHHDSLTGLVNRGYFLEIAATEVGRSHRYGENLSLMLVDLDHFKRVNDTRGHHAGDVALQTCARVLREQCREFDVAARIGGEEFIVLLPNTAASEAANAAERLREAIAAQPVVLEDGGRFHLTASIGIAGLLPGESLRDTMRRADAALYAAKEGGRNRVETAPGGTPVPAPLAEATS